MGGEVCSMRSMVLRICLIIVGVAVITLLYSRFRAEAPGRGVLRYQGSAVVGNSRLLVAEDTRGSLIGLFWPGTGRYANMQDSQSESRSRFPTDSYLGISTGGRLHWLRDAQSVSQGYIDGTNVLVTRYSLDGGLQVKVADWVLPESDVLLRRIRVESGGDRDTTVVSCQNPDLGGDPDADSAEYRDGLVVQWRRNPDIALAVGSTVTPQRWHTGTPRSLQGVRNGEFNSTPGQMGDAATAAEWPMDDELTLVYAFAASAEEAVSLALRTMVIPSTRLQAETETDWRKWLRFGTGPNLPDKRMADLYTRSLLVLKLLQDRRTGAITAGPRPHWSYCWPRDCAFAGVAFDVSGHHEEAEALYRFLKNTQRPDGLWEARYETDGSPVSDGRKTQIDSVGYFPWGVWVNFEETGDREFAREMYPAVRKAMEHLLHNLDADTSLPGPSSDYWEFSKPATYYLSNAIVCWAGLTASARLAEALGQSADAPRYRSAAESIEEGIRGHLWDNEKQSYVRAVEKFRGADSFSCLAVSPFGLFSPGDEKMALTVKRLESRLLTRQGGIVPGEDWRRRDAWTPETAFLLLYHASAGNEVEAARYFNWFADAAMDTGCFPERILGRNGEPDSTTPLTWTHALFILAATERWGQGLPELRDRLSQRRSSP